MTFVQTMQIIIETVERQKFNIFPSFGNFKLCLLNFVVKVSCKNR